ncbi:MAG: META domain-containing protein, partial [Xanthobacteraceae bacterium]
IWTVRASEPFPFGSELMLDAAPMHGSKRVPMIEIEDDGTASIDLWCASLKAQATVNNAAITIVPGDPPPAQCDPDRQARDAELLATLTQVTGWRRSGEVVELIGATPLRFHLMTN